MNNITLFFTKHGENGNCNITELYNIIVNLKPNVIFEEIPPSQFEEYYKYLTKEKLESSAIKLYSLEHDIKQIPVDLDIIMPQSFWDKNRYMFELIEKRNKEFCLLCDYDSLYSRQYGFNYLNSIYCVNNNKERYKEMEATLKILDKKYLYESFEEWNNIIDKRENEMINNIYGYCKNNIFDKGIFFIGAAHRESIINKIKKYSEIKDNKINWNYFEYDNNCENIINI